MPVNAATMPELPAANASETAKVVQEVFGPLFARGLLKRRPKVVSMAERKDAGRQAVRRMEYLREVYGAGPLMLTLPVRKQALILDPEHVRMVLYNTPDPFAALTAEKRSALKHFQPHGVLISHGAERDDRRRFNEIVLGFDSAVHPLAERFVRVADEEARELVHGIPVGGDLTWYEFYPAWFRMVRRVIFGDAARDDTEVTDLIEQLRHDANWAFLKPVRTRVRRRLFDKIDEHLTRAEPGSLAAVMAATPKTAMTDPVQQVPQWLFAFDPAGMNAFRTMALLATHDKHAHTAREEMALVPSDTPRNMPFLRACLLDSLRLWPTTPAVLRQCTRPIIWDNGFMPERTGVAIYAPFFHRHSQLPFSDTFAPGLWLQPHTPDDWPLIPFSDGPAQCPGQNIVLLLASAMITSIMTRREVRLIQRDRLDPDLPLPSTFDQYTIGFRLGRHPE